MSKRLFVGGLAYSLTEAQLKELFSEIGVNVVSCNLIIDRYSGQSKGFGFVEIDDEKDAEKAIQTLNGKEVSGRKIAVNVARPMEERPQRNFQSNRDGFSRRPRENHKRREY